MLDTLLRTKLFAPPLRPELVSRPHLIDRLNQGLAPGSKLALVSGPAGSGKTTLLSQFMVQVGCPVGWLALDKADNDLVRFWTYLIAACQSALHEMGESALQLLDTPQPVPQDTIPVMLINHLVQQEEDLVLVLDDYHVIQNPAIHEGVSYLLKYLPDNILLVVATRADPPWPLARFRARNQLIEVRARELHFNAGESAQFLNGTMGLQVSANDVAALEARTEGWVAGLQLAAVALHSLLSSQEHEPITAFIQDFAGSNLFVAEYLLQEVLQRQPDDRRAFLLQTSILQRMNAELCNALMGRQDSAAMLADIKRANLFIIPLDMEGQWFRYHHLFADLLQVRLEREQGEQFIAERHTRAAIWFEQNGFVAESISHLLAAEAYEQVAVLAEREARTMMFTGRVSTLRTWLEALPPQTMRMHPRLQIYSLWIDLMQERLAPTPQLLAQKETLLQTLPPSPENTRLQVELSAVLCRFVALTGDTVKATKMAEEALQRLPETEIALRARAYSALAIAHWMAGNQEQASQNYDQCVPLAREASNWTLAAHATFMMGMSHADYGRLHDAAATYQSIVDMGVQAREAVFFPAGQGYIGLASIHLEWNELKTAEVLLHKGMTLCRRSGLAGLSTGHLVEVRLRQARGDLQGAAAAAELLDETGVDPSVTSRVIMLMVALGDLDRAYHVARPWLAALAGDHAGPPPPLLAREIMQVTLARLFLARGERERALRLLDEVQATAETGGRLGRLIEAHLFRALVQDDINPGNPTGETLQSLASALRLARPEGYTSLFLEQGPAITSLLRAASDDPDLPAEVRQYAQRLLDASASHGKMSPPKSSGAAASLVETLTPREMEVLQLVSIGDSNQAIADKLVISIRTVKKHVTNILGKLGVSNRTQAVARARVFGLISAD